MSTSLLNLWVTIILSILMDITLAIGEVHGSTFKQ